MRYLFEHLGVAVFAITGVLAAKNKRVDLFGVIVLALVTALGGGTLRDLILRTDPFWMSDTSFVLTASATAAVTFVVARCWEPPAAKFDRAEKFKGAWVAFEAPGVEPAFAAPDAKRKAIDYACGHFGGSAAKCTSISDEALPPSRAASSLTVAANIRRVPSE